MTSIKPATPPQSAQESPVVVGPWPSYGRFNTLPERQRWVMYGAAKAYRESLEMQGFVMSEPYDAFVRRVCDELEI